MTNLMLNDDPLWFKDAIIYEAPVRAFADSNGDGIGDFRGLTGKLDYLQDLGITAVWLLPFFPSPLRDDGYDISDYHNVNPIYGTLDDFKEFLEAAHQRGIRVIIELIINHTSDQHPWFQRARLAPEGSPERDFYVWSDTPDKYKEARIIFQDFETSNWAWDPIAKAYYWHRFYSHQPDLNYDNPAVREAVFDVLDFWLGMGVDGLRMDAVPYLYEREGTNCENLPETHEFLKQMRSHVDEKFSNRMLLAEANQWPEDAAEYYGQGNECHMNFHFPLMPRLFMALKMEDSFPLIDIIQQTPQVPDNCQWALFLRNHDELTLEMVTDEDRDYMYRVYAKDTQARINLGIRRRLTPLMASNRNQIELMNCLLLALPGTPVIYYGDEIGMGDNIYLGDRNGVRTPMQWSADRNAGFSRANPQKLYLPVIIDPEHHYEAVNVETQQANSNSLWWWTKRMLGIRQRFQAFGRGSFEFLHPENRKVLAFTRTYAGEHILVVANLSRFIQAVELDLSAFSGMKPVEIFGRTEFPEISEEPYFLSLGPHAFYWFTLQAQASQLQMPQTYKPHSPVVVNDRWETVFSASEAKTTMESILADYLYSCRWFGGKARKIRSTHIRETIPVPFKEDKGYLVLLQVEYTEGDPETYMLPLAYGEEAVGSEQVGAQYEHGVANIQIRGQDTGGVLYEALFDKDFLNIPLEAIAHHHKFSGKHGDLVTLSTDVLKNMGLNGTHLEPSLLRGEQSNSSINYGDRLILKLFRKVEEGINPDLEIGRFLTEKKVLEHFAAVAGALEYRTSDGGMMTLGILQEFIPDTRDAWSYTLDGLRDYFEHVMLLPEEQLQQIQLPSEALSGQPNAENPPIGYDAIANYLSSTELLAQRTAELHLALASDTENPNFAPEAFSSFYQRSIYQYMRNLTGQVLLLLKKRLDVLPPETQQLAQTILNRHEQIMDRFKALVNQKITAMRIRCHGDYHLGQVLFTGKDFIIIDFEGEPARPLGERRMKRSPLRDVAGMLQSFNYAITLAFRNEVENGLIRPDNQQVMEQWSQFWFEWVSNTYMNTYLATASDASFIPKTNQELQVLLDAYLFEKSIYELGYELNNRPDWVDIPLKRILQLLESSALSNWKPQGS
jgi:maltose alpha-D-glucosyltransferase/alpha-amylase